MADQSPNDTSSNIDSPKSTKTMDETKDINKTEENNEMENGETNIQAEADVHSNGVEEEGKYVALFDFEPRETGDLGFKKGDILSISDNSGDWWLAINENSTDEGYVPCNYIQPVNSLTAEEWFFQNTTKLDANNLLLAPALKTGDFIVRDSDTEKGSYSLSMREKDAEGLKIKHYRIMFSKKDSSFFMAKKRKFKSVQKLVQFYKENSKDLPCRLGKACPREKPGTKTLGRSVWEIERDSFKWIHKLGEGSFGEVWKAIWKDRVPVAVKSLRQSSMSTEGFLEEARIMKELRHDKLVPLYGICSTQEPIYIVTELMSKGSLLDYLRKGDGKTSDYKTLVDIAAQVAFGMSYLEMKNFIHRDLAARNVLVGENNMVKVADFGLARVVSDQFHQTKEDSPFPIRWTAPEAICKQQFSIKSDVWSFGILLFEVFTRGEVPYAGVQASEIYSKIESGYRLPKPRFCSEKVYKVMGKCWDEDPEMRPTFIYLHRFLEQSLEYQSPTTQC
ncbi:tyrosine-protein kinase yes-like [Apostichopus japonicus]|uniref:tyrosine-protein kinase yes-like n=1 Tax=Stichopus japonicus TaxID=307972 RepID=UPI003AB18E40